MSMLRIPCMTIIEENMQAFIHNYNIGFPI